MIIIKRLVVYLLLFFMMSYSVWAQEKADSPDALRQLAVNYEHGRANVKQDYQEAFQLYCQAALKGDAESAYNIGFMYFNGRGKQRDLGLAVRWFTQAADAGDDHAQKMLARYSDVLPVEDADCKSDETELWLEVDTHPNIGRVKTWVEQIASHYDIDPALVMAVIRAESGFNITALSNKNAQGLMQLIPETAERFGVKNSWDPVQNIKGGTAYLHWLLRHFEGRVDWVLAAYNAGEGAVERYKGIPPYQETRNYVKRIMNWYHKSFHPVPSAASGELVIKQKI